MSIALSDGGPDKILATIDRLLRDPDVFNPEFRQIDFGDWAKVNIYIPEPDVNSSITPPFMEAFLVLQKQIYQLAALGESGVADVGQLSFYDKYELQISVVVTDGSSNYIAPLVGAFESLLKRMTNKMTGKQAAIVLVAMAGILATPWGTGAYLDYLKTIKMEEIRSKEYLEALSALQFSDERHHKTLDRLLEILEKQGDIGKRAIDALALTNDALLKAASVTPQTHINRVEVTPEEADLLRVPSRRKSQTRVVVQEVIVVDINTADPSDLQIVIMDPDSKDQHRFKFRDSLLAGLDRDKLFDSLKNRSTVWVELALKEIDGEVRSVEFLRTREAPQHASASSDPIN